MGGLFEVKAARGKAGKVIHRQFNDCRGYAAIVATGWGLGRFAGWKHLAEGRADVDEMCGARCARK